MNDAPQVRIICHEPDHAAELAARLRVLGHPVAVHREWLAGEDDLEDAIHVVTTGSAVTQSETAILDSLLTGIDAWIESDGAPSGDQHDGSLVLPLPTGPRRTHRRLDTR